MSHAVVLAAHGAGDGSPANRAAEALARALVERGVVDEACAAFHRGTPHFSAVLDGLRATTVTIVPLLTSAGYYTEQVLPREVARNRRFPQVTVQRTAAVGEHPGLVAVADRRFRALATLLDHPPDACHLIVVGHGTPRHARSRAATAVLVERLRQRGLGARVSAAFLDDEPTVETVLADGSDHPIVVIPFLMGGGDHVLADLPRRLGCAAHGPPWRGGTVGRPLLCDTALGTAPEVLDVVADLVRPRPRRAVADPRCWRVGTRGSRLALWQTARVTTELQASGARVETVVIETAGDRLPDRPIAELPGPAPFVDALSDALRCGAIDLAVHSLKDVAPGADPDLDPVAFLPRGPLGEALVSVDHLPLAALPAGARVGTSSIRRTLQLNRLRPDLHCVPLRGTVEARVAQVTSRAMDAAVLAVAGLDRLELRGAITECFSLDALLPDPGQGAIVVQARRDDAAARAACAALDDSATRRSTTAERLLLQRCSALPDHVVAAWCVGTHDLQLHGRLLARDGGLAHDVVTDGADPEVVAHAAYAALSRTLAAAQVSR